MDGSDMTAGLVPELESMQRELDAEVGRLEQSFARLVTEHRGEMTAAQKEIVGLGEREAQLFREAEQLRTQVDTENQQKEGLKTAIHDLRLRVEEFAPRIKQLVEQENQMAERLVVSRADVQRKDRSKTHDLHELTRGMMFFARLGLFFIRMQDNSLRLIFTKLDPRDPAREFSFVLTIDEREEYRVSDCVPAVQHLPRLVAKINTDNDLSAFVTAMRTAFKATCAEVEEDT